MQIQPAVTIPIQPTPQIQIILILQATLLQTAAMHRTKIQHQIKETK